MDLGGVLEKKTKMLIHKPSDAVIVALDVHKNGDDEVALMRILIVIPQLQSCGKVDKNPIVTINGLQSRNWEM